MAKKRYQAEQIICKLREAEVEISKGQTIGQIVKRMGITEQTYYRWRKEYGGLQTDQAKRLKELEKENARLKTLAARGVPGAPGLRTKRSAIRSS
jgi:putative transposase